MQLNSGWQSCKRKFRVLRRPTVAAMELLAKVLRRVLPFVSLLTLFIATNIAVKFLCQAMSVNFSNVVSASVVGFRASNNCSVVDMFCNLVCESQKLS